jgi:protein-disulfide isomerase
MTAAVTLVEFSDFQCPSCKHANSYMKKVLQKYGSKVRYLRVDFPIMSHHPWAFGASAAARAIYRQSPQAFWKFKDWVYENQDSLSTFTLDEFAVNFVKDNGLDVARYDRDLISTEVRGQVLSGISLAHDVDVAATPTFMVNGVFVDPGQNGSAMDAYLAQKLAGK